MGIQILLDILASAQASGCGPANPHQISVADLQGALAEIDELKSHLIELRGQWTEEHFAKGMARQPKPSEGFNGDDEAWADFLQKICAPISQEEFWRFCQQQEGDEVNHHTPEYWRIAITRAFDLMHKLAEANKRLEEENRRDRRRSDNEKLNYKRAITAEAVLEQIEWSAPFFVEIYRIERDGGEDPIFDVRLKVGSQAFTVVPDQHDDLGEAEFIQRMLIRALANLVDQYSADTRIEEPKKQVGDLNGWIDKYRENSIEIGKLLAEFREKRSTGEPARNDVEEIRALIQRWREAEADRDGKTSIIESTMESNQAFKNQWVQAESLYGALRETIEDIIKELDQQNNLSRMGPADGATQGAITEADRIAGLLRGALGDEVSLIQKVIQGWREDAARANESANFQLRRAESLIRRLAESATQIATLEEQFQTAAAVWSRETDNMEAK